MKNIFNLLSYFSLVLLLAGCQDEFLDRVPETSIGKENFFNTEDDLNLYIYGLYNFPAHGQLVEDRSTDNAATTGATEIKTMMISQPSAATIQNGWDWEQLREINFFLENFDKADIPEARLNHFEGLARFFRARFYSDMVKRYSDVPWYDQVISSDNEELLFKSRDPRAFIVDKIMEDFSFAAEHVDGESREGEVNAWVVKSYFTRFALYEGTFRKYHPELELQSTADDYIRQAASIAKDIMDNGGFAIYSTGDPLSDYGRLFNSSNLEGNPEVIFARHFENETLNSGWWAYMFGNYEVSPSKDLLQAYLMADGTFYTSEPGYETKLFVEEFDNRDPRLYQTYAYPGWELRNTSTYSQGGGIYVQQLAKNFTGYHQIKGFINNPDVVEQNSADFPIIRYAEVLLIYAEAKAELGELNQADLDISINQLRDRAGMPALNLNPPIDPIQEARYPTINSPQKSVLLEIRRERRIELALEGYRFDDLMRWGAGALLEQEPEGIYFPGLGNYDLTADGVADIKLIEASASIPENRELNELGQPLIYYRAGTFGQDVGVFLKEGNAGSIQTMEDRGTFVAPKYYYRPIPQTDVVLNPNLEQIFGW
ncbi:MAG: RagB/SusD family nutrient uptake outer membrane protein [Cyclobacteriaceae bacterium]